MHNSKIENKEKKNFTFQKVGQFQFEKNGSKFVHA